MISHCRIPIGLRGSVSRQSLAVCRRRQAKLRSLSDRRSSMTEEGKVLALNQKLLDSIASNDIGTYALLCSNDMTCFEPESRGTLVQGQDFHKWYFDQHKQGTQKPNQTMCGPKVRMLGSDAAVVTYVRLQQKNTEEGFRTLKSEETRIWQLIDGAWLNVHFHRSETDMTW